MLYDFSQNRFFCVRSALLFKVSVCKFANFDTQNTQYAPKLLKLNWFLEATHVRPAGRPTVIAAIQHIFCRVGFTYFGARSMYQNPLIINHFNLRYAWSSRRLLFCMCLHLPVVLVKDQAKIRFLSSFLFSRYGCAFFVEFLKSFFAIFRYFSYESGFLMLQYIAFISRILRPLEPWTHTSTLEGQIVDCLHFWIRPN